MASGQTPHAGPGAHGPGAGAYPARCSTNNKTSGANSLATSNQSHPQDAQLSFNNNNAPSSDFQQNLASPDSPGWKGLQQRYEAIGCKELRHLSGVEYHQEGSRSGNCDHVEPIGRQYCGEIGSDFGCSQLGGGSNSRESDSRAKNNPEHDEMVDQMKEIPSADAPYLSRAVSNSIPPRDDSNDFQQIRDYRDSIRDFSDGAPNVKDFSDDARPVRDMSDDGPCIVDHIQSINIFNQFNSKQSFPRSK